MLNSDETISGSLNQTQKIHGSLYVPTNGLSAYQLAVLNGYDGTVEEWLDSLYGTINGINNLEIISGKNITLETVGNTIIINADDISSISNIELDNIFKD